MFVWLHTEGTGGLLSVVACNGNCEVIFHDTFSRQTDEKLDDTRLTMTLAATARASTLRRQIFDIMNRDVMAPFLHPVTNGGRWRAVR